MRPNAVPAAVDVHTLLEFGGLN